MLKLPVRGTGEGAVSGAVSHEGALSSDISADLIRNSGPTESPRAENIVPVLINCEEINIQTAIRYYFKAVKQEGNKNRLFSIPLKIPKVPFFDHEYVIPDIVPILSILIKIHRF